jgi:hypothetical protein
MELKISSMIPCKLASIFPCVYWLDWQSMQVQFLAHKIYVLRETPFKISAPSSAFPLSNPSAFHTQQILGNCSPLSISSRREVPIFVFKMIFPSGEFSTVPMCLAEPPSGSCCMICNACFA